MKPIGYRRNGRPIWPIQGGTNTFGITARAYRWYEDGTESGAAALAAENTSYDLLVISNAPIVLRYGVQESGSGSASGASTDDYQLQYNLNGAGYNDVTTSSSVVQGYTSSNLTDAAATTQRLSAGTGSFIAGEISETDGLLTDWQLTANNHSELLFAIQVIAADTANNDSITFRVLRNGAVFNTYSVTPTLTVNVDQTVTADATSVTPSLPNASLTHRLSADATSVTPSLPNADVQHRLAGAVVTVTPTLPDGALQHRILADATTATPTIPDATLDTGTQIDADAAVTATPSLPNATIQTRIAADVTSATPSLPNAEVARNRAIVTWVAVSIPNTATGGAQTVTADSPVSATPSLPNASVDHHLIADATTVTPTIPNADVQHRLAGAVVSATPTLPDGSIVIYVQADATTATPALPDATIQTRIAGEVTTATPTLPDGALQHRILADATTVTPSVPDASVNHRIYADATSATPSVPDATITQATPVSGEVVSVTPSIPDASLTHLIYGFAVEATPTLPDGTVQAVAAVPVGGGRGLPLDQQLQILPRQPRKQQVKAQVLTLTPVLPDALLLRRPSAQQQDEDALILALL